MVFSFSACSGRRDLPPFPPAAADQPAVIHVAVHDNWHTGIILPNEFLSDDLRRLTSQFNSFRYTEFGWGDEDFYRATEVTFFITLKAAFWPSASTLHVMGINKALKEYATESIIYRIELSEDGFSSLCNFIAATFSKDAEGNPIVLGPYPDLTCPNLFFQARPKFFFPRTCNTWTAKALQAAGLPVSAWNSISAKSLAGNIEEYSSRIRPPCNKKQMESE